MFNAFTSNHKRIFNTTKATEFKQWVVSNQPPTISDGSGCYTKPSDKSWFVNGEGMLTF